MLISNSKLCLPLSQECWDERCMPQCPDFLGQFWEKTEVFPYTLISQYIQHPLCEHPIWESKAIIIVSWFVLTKFIVSIRVPPWCLQSVDLYACVMFAQLHRIVLCALPMNFVLWVRFEYLKCIFICICSMRQQIYFISHFTCFLVQDKHLPLECSLVSTGNCLDCQWLRWG